MQNIVFAMNSLRALVNSTSLNSSIILRPVLCDVSSVRFASHKVKRNTRQKAKQPGVKRMDGDYIRKGEILVKQFNLHFHPGLNVSIENDNTLISMREGVVMMTCERINPEKGNPIADKYYANMTAPSIYKRYFHVVPFKQGQKFKLINLV